MVTGMERPGDPGSSVFVDEFRRSSTTVVSILKGAFVTVKRRNEAYSVKGSGFFFRSGARDTSMTHWMTSSSPTTFKPLKKQHGQNSETKLPSLHTVDELVSEWLLPPFRVDCCPGA